MRREFGWPGIPLDRFNIVLVTPHEFVYVGLQISTGIRECLEVGSIV